MKTGSERAHASQPLLKPKRAIGRRLALLAFVAGVFTLLTLAGLPDLIREPERAQAILVDLGLWAPFLYVLSFALLEPFFVPGIAFILPGAFVWSFPVLFALSWLGSIGAGIVGFGFARTLGRDHVEAHLPQRLRRYDEALAERGLRTVILIRLTLFLAPPAHWLLGLSRVGFGTFVLGTAIGFIPGLALVTYLASVLGQSFGEWLGTLPPAAWGAIAALLLGLFAARALFKRRRVREEAP